MVCKFSGAVRLARRRILQYCTRRLFIIRFGRCIARHARPSELRVEVWRTRLRSNSARTVGASGGQHPGCGAEKRLAFDELWGADIALSQDRL